VELKELSSAERLRQAEEVSAAELADEFNQSVVDFAGFFTEQPFFEDPSDIRDAGKNPKSDRRTYGWAMSMKAQDRVRVEGAPKLDFVYVEREIIPTRTKPQVNFDVDEAKQIRVDLILSNAEGRRPIIAELKIASDKDPFTGLVQALAGAAQLVSPSQRARLAKLRAPVAQFEEDRLLDIYVLLAEFQETGRDRPSQLRHAARLAPELEAMLEKQIGRIRILGLRRAPGSVEATTSLPSV
jgi:hypothetical protein